MQTITFEVDDALLEGAQVEAQRQGTTVEAIVVAFLEAVARCVDTRDDAQRAGDMAEARRRLLELMDNTKGDVSPDRTFSRDKIDGR